MIIGGLVNRLFSVFLGLYINYYTGDATVAGVAHDQGYRIVICAMRTRLDISFKIDII
jgi:hypothetical protein